MNCSKVKRSYYLCEIKIRYQKVARIEINCSNHEKCLQALREFMIIFLEFEDRVAWWFWLQSLIQEILEV